MMHSSNSDMYSPFYILRGDDIDKNGDCDAGELLQSAGNEIRLLDSAGISGSSGINMSSNLQFGELLPSSFGISAETASSGVAVEREQFMLHKAGLMASAAADGCGAGGGNGHFGNWGDSGLAAAHHSHQTETNSAHNYEEINQLGGVDHGRFIGGGDSYSTDQSKGRFRDQKLQSNQQRLTQLDQARQQVASGFWGGQNHSIGGRGAERGTFDADHALWLRKHQRLIDDLRSSMSSDACERQLHLLVDEAISHYGELFRIKRTGARSDAFHILSGVWKTPVEQCLMWLGGFRSSNLLKVLEKQIQPLTEQQLVGICNLQQSCQKTEDALSQGMEALQQSLLHTLSSTCIGRRAAGDVADYARQMVVAMTNIETIENFLNQADLLRLHTLEQLQRILTARQAARALVAINDYKSRLRALSSLWLARPKE